MQNPSRFDHLAAGIARAALRSPFTLDAALEPLEQWIALCEAYRTDYPDAQKAAQAAAADLQATLRDDQRPLAASAEDARLYVHDIERSTACELGKRYGRAEAHQQRRTPLEMFNDLLTGVAEVHHRTPEGTDYLRTQVRAALPYLPAIIAAGEWSEWTDGPTAQAVNAVAALHAPSEHDHPQNIGEMDALYIVGLLTGLALAHALQGAYVGGAR